MISPMAYSGLSASKVSARANMRIGPTIQFWTSDSPRIFVLRKTWGSSSYFTLASGGYIMRMRPSAIGIEVVPTVNRVMARARPGNRKPEPTPRSHGQEDPEREVTVKERQAAHDPGTADCGGLRHGDSPVLVSRVAADRVSRGDCSPPASTFPLAHRMPKMNLRL